MPTLPKWITSRPRLLYGLFTGLAFIVALRWTFPSEAVRERLIYEAGARGWQIDVQDVGPAGLMGVRMDEVSLTDAAGLKIPVTRLDASIRLLPLLVGKRVLAFEAEAFDGTIGGRADLSGAERRLLLDLEGVNLKSILPLRKATGVDFTGLVSGKVDLLVPGAERNKASGTIDVSIEQAGVAGGSAVIPPFSQPMTVPPVSLGTLTLSAKADKGRLVVDKLEFRGGDADVTGEGVSVTLAQRMEFAPVVGRLRFKLSESLWKKPAAAPMRPMVEAALMNARAPDGSYTYQVFGNLSAPQLRPGNGGGPPPPQ